MTTLHALLDRSAQRSSQAIAISDPARGERASYGELRTFADRVRSTLRACGVGPGRRVGVYAPKSIATVGAVFGILEAEAAYVPVAYDNPPARNAFVFRDCGVDALIIAPDLLERLRSASDDEWQLADHLGTFHSGALELQLVTAASWSGAPPSPPDLAYILYTSGSTGRPKGVMHTHASALSFVDWCSEVLAPASHSRFSAHAPLHFDLSILDLYVPVKHGGTIVLLSEDLGKQPLPLAEAIARERVTHWYSTPSILRLLVEFGRLERCDFSSLEVVCFAGEVFPIKHLRALQEAWPMARYLNLYGPTETNVCTYYEVRGTLAPDHTESLPIGWACSGDQARVVDESGHDVPAGVEGELLIAGGSVMVGYWNLPERNESAFAIDRTGTRWYRTGDLVKDGHEGYLFLGRRDRMVKRRGYRIELGEIESALHRHPDVSAGAAISSNDSNGDVRIKAFIEWTGSKKPSLIALKRFCAQHLPPYMIPDEFIPEESLPKTSTGKIDYQRLRDLAQGAPSAAQSKSSQ